MTTETKETKKLFEPSSTEELLRGWLLHSHKGRQRHDRAARPLDGERLWLGAIATVFSAVVGTSVFAAFKEGSLDELKVIIATISILSAILTGLSTFLNLSERSEKHRSAGVRYKAVIRELERRLEGIGNSTIKSSVLDEIQKRLDELEENSPIVPERIFLLVDNDWNTRGVEIIKKATDFYKPKGSLPG